MDEHTTERGAKPMIDGAVYAFSFIDDDASRTEMRMRVLSRAMGLMLRKLQVQYPGAEWRDKCQITRDGDKVRIRARLAVVSH